MSPCSGLNLRCPGNRLIVGFRIGDRARHRIEHCHEQTMNRSHLAGREAVDEFVDYLPLLGDISWHEKNQPRRSFYRYRDAPLLRVLHLHLRRLPIRHHLRRVEKPRDRQMEHHVLLALVLPEPSVNSRQRRRE